jgi:hypothetical protein
LRAAIEEDFTKTGYRGVLEADLDGFTELSKHTYVSSYALAEIYVRLGEKEKAFAQLQ